MFNELFPRTFPSIYIIFCKKTKLVKKSPLSKNGIYFPRYHFHVLIWIYVKSLFFFPIPKVQDIAG